jgi:hypothetical protein
MDDNNNYNTYADVTYHSVGNTVEPTSKPKKHGHGKIIALALVVSLLGGAAGAGGVLALSNKQSVRSSQILEGTRPSTVIDVATIDTTKQLTPHLSQQTILDLLQPPPLLVPVS